MDRFRVEQPTKPNPTVEDVIEGLELNLEDFDFIVFGDGSGTTIGSPCAWCCYLYHVESGDTSRHFGGTRSGTNNLAELMPYVLALWHINGVMPAGSKPRVAIISDSEVTVRCGSGQYARKANGSIWASIEWFERNGFQLHWKHVRRNTNFLNEQCDGIAGDFRKQIEAFK